MKFDDKVAASPGVMKVARKSLAVAIKLAAKKSVFAPNAILNVRNAMIESGYKPSVPMIAEDIGPFCRKRRISTTVAARIICDELDVMDLDGVSLRVAVNQIINR